MEAERELDALVAEKVMGKPPDYYHCPHFDKNRRMLAFCLCPSLPHYSKHIKAAWAIAEKYKKDWSTTVSVEDGKYYHCYINSNSEGHFDRDGEWPKRLGSAISTDSAAHAICIAALVAVGAIEQEKY